MRRYQFPHQSLLFSFASRNVNDQKTKSFINAVSEKLGIAFVMTDFGLEYSSLSQIKQINYEFFKIDKFYLSDCGSNDLSMQIIFLIINLAAALHKDIIIEGIDDVEIFACAQQFNCKYMKGLLAGEEVKVPLLLDQHDKND